MAEHDTAVRLTATSNQVQRISINELLSTCVDVCFRGCAEIRAVQEKRELTGSLSKVDFKDEMDPKSALTEADGAAQAAILSALRREWGSNLRIVGEEEEEDDDDDSTPISTTLEATIADLRRDMCMDILTADTLPISDITIFVDPLDGTREFVESRLSNCQTLVGIAVNGQPVAGAIGVPFPDGTLTKDATVVYGHVGAGHGVVGTPHIPSNTEYEERRLPRPYVASGDSTAPVMVTGRKLALGQAGGGGSSVLYGGAGNKILATAFGHVDCTVQHRYGGPWDTCASAAVLRSMGGRITNLIGEDILTVAGNDDDAALPPATELGFVATGVDSAIDHDELVAALRASSVVQEYLKND